MPRKNGDNKPLRNTDHHEKNPEIIHKCPANVLYSREQIKDIFISADRNRDRHLSWDEVKAAFAKLGAFSPVYRAWRAQSCADADNDGVISLQDELDELVNYAMKLKFQLPR